MLLHRDTVLLILATAASAGAHGAGLWLDPAHYQQEVEGGTDVGGDEGGRFAGLRVVAESPAHNLTIVGTEDGKDWWALANGSCSGADMSVISFEFSPTALSGTWATATDGAVSITWPDGNVWRQLASESDFTLAWPGGDGGSMARGLFKDPNHVTAGSMAGTRFIADLVGGDGTTLAMVGTDDGEAWWSVFGATQASSTAASSEVFFDFSPKGGPAGLTGTLAEDPSLAGLVVLTWADGNVWTRIAAEEPEPTLQDSVVGALAPIGATIVVALLWCCVLFVVRTLALYVDAKRGRRPARLPDEGDALPPAKEDGEGAPPAVDMEPAPCCTINPLVAALILVGIAVFKTLITKVLFAEMNTPVAYSILSCLVTNMGISLWFAAVPGSLKFLTAEMTPTFAAVCVAIAIDLGCSNVAISLLSVALQQVIRAAAPAATMLIEVVIKRKPQRPLMVLAVVFVSIGPVLTQLGSSMDASALGLIMQLLAVFGSASKSVFGHSILTQHKKRLGLLSFLFWAEWFTAAMLLPWATLNGEIADMWQNQRPAIDWAILYFTASVGGIRIWSQMLFLQQTSATSLAISSIAVTALTSSLSIVIFQTPTTPLLIAGIVETVAATSWYAYLKLKAKKTAESAKK